MTRLWAQDDGGLAGARFDKAIKNDTRKLAGNIAGLPALAAENDDTVATELRTKLTVGGQTFSIGNVLGEGSASMAGDNFVAKALETITKERNQLSLAVEAFGNATGTDKTVLDGVITRRWNAADNAIQKIFGSEKELVRETDPDDVVGAFDELVVALSSLAAFEAATETNGDGVFDDFLAGTGKTAAEVFDAAKSTTTAIFGSTASTRYGAVVTKERKLPTDKLAISLGTDGLGAAGAFSYATVDDTVRTHHIATSGNAYYEGGTTAVTGNGTLYSGDIALEVRFRSNKVSGLVTNLATAEGEPWVYNYGEVDSIILPDANLLSTASWAATEADGGQVTYSLRAGSPSPQPEDASFKGQLLHKLGSGLEGSEAVGVWSFGRDADKDTSSYIAGGFGAERVPDDQLPSPPVVDDDGTGVKTKVLSDGEIADGNLTLKGTQYDGAAKVFKEFYTTISLGTDETLPANSLLTLGRVTLGEEASGTPNDATDDYYPLLDKNGNNVMYDSNTTDTTAAQAVYVTVNTTTNALTTVQMDGSTALALTLTGVTVTLDNRMTAYFDEKFNLGLATMFANQGSLKWVNGKRQIELAHTRITQLRNQLVRWVALDGDDATSVDRALANAERTKIWSAINEELRDRVFGDKHPLLGGTLNVLDVNAYTDARSWSKGYPVSQRGNALDEEALADIDAVLDALSSNSNFTDALEDGGVFGNLNHKNDNKTADDLSDDPIVAVGDIWNRKTSRVQYLLDATEYTRFGAWRKQTNLNAKAGYVSLKAGGADGPSTFAYSPVAPTVYTSAGDPNFPRGGSAVYSGRTVAIQDATFYTGAVDVRVSWQDTWKVVHSSGDENLDGTDYSNGDLRSPNIGTKTGEVGDVVGGLTAVISGLADPNGDPLLQKTYSIPTDDADTSDTFEQLGALKVTSKTIGEVIITGVLVTSKVADDNKLMFTKTDPGTKIAFLDRGSAEQQIVGAETGSESNGNAASVMGTFVGKDIDGPLGLIGTWTLMDNHTIEELSGFDPDDSNNDQNTIRWDHVGGALTNDVTAIGNGATLRGAFGAEIAP